MNSQHPVFFDISPGPLPGMHNEQYLLLLDSATVRHCTDIMEQVEYMACEYCKKDLSHLLRSAMAWNRHIFWELEPVAHWWGKKGPSAARWQDYVILGADISVDEDDSI